MTLRYMGGVSWDDWLAGHGEAWDAWETPEEMIAAMTDIARLDAEPQP